MLTRLFSKKAIADVQGLVAGKVRAIVIPRFNTHADRSHHMKVVDLCNSFERLGSQPVDLFYAFRCMSVDVITCE